MTRFTPAVALGIFAKAPVPGRVKTRLAAVIGPEAAARWYTQSLRVVFRRTAHAWPEVERILFYDPPTAAAAFDAIAHTPEHRTPQRGTDLGARMAAALHYCFDCGKERPVLIGTDAPSMPVEYVEQAWTALATCDVAIGPATDGGYYLIGTRDPQPRLFEDIPWSTSAVFSATLEHAAALGLHVHRLPEWFDVDTAEDLAALPAGWDAEA